MLGFELVEDSPSTTDDGRPKRWVVVRPPGGATGLLLAQADGDEQAAAIGRQTAGESASCLRVDDFDAVYERLAAHHVEFVGRRPPVAEPNGHGIVVIGARDRLQPPQRVRLGNAPI